MNKQVLSFSTGFVEKLKSQSSKDFEFTTPTIKKIGKKVQTMFLVWENNKQGAKMEVTITKNSIVELENAVINFLK